MTIRALVVDDEPLARRRLRRLLAAHDDVEVIGEASGGDEAIGVAVRERPDVLLLDIQMPGSTGLEALRALRSSLPEERRPAVIFTTAHERHAVEAFELDVVDYLLKPVEAARLGEALDRLRRRMGESSRADGSPGPRSSASSGHLAALDGDRIVSLAHEEVAAVVVEDGLVFARTVRGRHRVRATLGEVEARLPAPPFVRVSRAAILNLAWIAHLEPEDSGTYLARMRAPVDLGIGVSRRRARELRELLGW